MSRKIQEDFNELRTFLETYTLAGPISVSEFTKNLKTQHRKLYSMMLYVSELDFQNNSDFTLHSKAYIKEMLSDFLQSLFCWCNGMYKPALLLLRSAIETFTKAVVGNNDQTVFVEKSMYAVFDRAKGDSWFNSPIGKKYYVNMHNTYVTLCKTVHSAKTENLEHINSVGILPKFDALKSKGFYEIFTYTINNILGLLLLNSRETYSKMHPANKQVFLDALPKKIKQEVLLEQAG